MASPLAQLKRRDDYVRVARRGRRLVTPGMILQVMRRGGDGEADMTVVRYGITASRRVGGAVTRNRARRRLRAAALRVLPEHAPPGCDVVLVASAATPVCPFASLLADLEGALHRFVAGTVPGLRRSARERRSAAP